MKANFLFDIGVLWTILPLIVSGFEGSTTITTTSTILPNLIYVSNSTNSSTKINLRQDEDGDGDGDGDGGGGDGVTNFLQAAINILDRFQPTTRATTLNPLGSFLGFEDNREFNTFSNGLSGFLLLANGAGNVLQQSFNRTRPRNETTAIAAQISNAINLFNTLNNINQQQQHQQQQAAAALAMNEEASSSNANEVMAPVTSPSLIPQQIFRATTRPPQTLIEVGYAGLLNFLAGGIRQQPPPISNSVNIAAAPTTRPPTPPPPPRTRASTQPTYTTTAKPTRLSTVSPEESIYLFLKNRFFSSTSEQPSLSENPSEASVVIDNLDVEIHSPEESNSQSSAPTAETLPPPKSTIATTTAATSISSTNRHHNFHNVQRLTHPTKGLEAMNIQTTTTPRTRVVTPVPGKPIYWMNMYYPNGLPATQS